MRLPLSSSIVPVLFVVLAGSHVEAQPAVQNHATSVVHYDLTVRLDPATSQIDVRASVEAAAATEPIEFLLAKPLEVVEASPPVEVVPAGDPARFFGNNGASEPLDAGRATRYRVTQAPRDGTVTLTYRGRLNFGLSAQKEEYTRGFRETRGIVGPEGVYLSGASLWYPHVGSGLVTFSIEARAPDGWHVISQGDGSSRDAGGAARWRTSAPMDEIYLVGGPLRVWRDRAGNVETLAYLHEDDAGLAGKYLAATAQYLEMYRQLIGPYPYSKFALVENFWETGYGMPSFTLLGPSIVRFPFILTSSYPHEILHNWWGNSVFVEYERGNWSEGLTAYLADHLIQEQRGRGADHRRATLQKYASYVRGERDFPLTEFRSRESAATEAVGYGRTMMGVHMLRLRLGDDRFRTWLQRVYREFRGRRAAFADLQRVAEDVAGQPLQAFFDDWIARAGAPVLAIGDVRVRREGADHVVSGVLRQTQTGAPYAFDVPIALQTEKEAVRATVRYAGRESPFEIRSALPPVALRADPDFDVFRALDPREIPPSLGQIFGEPRITAVLPSAASQADRTAWRALAEGWRSENHAIDIVSDADLQALPADRGVWLLGRENRLAASLFLDGTHVRADAAALLVNGERVPERGHSLVATRRHPGAPEKAIGWITNGVPAAFAGLGRKLPHYGRYSYLGFEGDEPVNTIKGEWSTTDSPLTLDLRPEGARTASLPALPAAAPKALIDLPPTFSQRALADHVAWLAAAEREGRGLGSAGLQQAADYIAKRFEAAGLRPGGEDGSWFQSVTVPAGPDGRPATGVNVIGYLPGSKPDFDGQAALVTAHYDHLGRGWPDAHAEHRGQVHAGADDNASGVAVLLELARVFGAAERAPRAIAFVAFTAEEAQLQGSRHYVAHPLPFALDKIIGVVNLDTVGRLGGGRISVLGAGTATEWPHIFRGAGFVTGIESTSVAGNFEASDQRAFIERGVPAVQIFTGPHADYHRPGDTADKVDTAGLVKVATVVREAVAYLAERPTLLTVTIGGTPTPSAGGQSGEGQAGGRRVSFGAVPDFAYQGPGVRMSDVTPASPAAAAGLQAGDVITKMGDTAVESLQTFSNVLRSLQPGQSVAVTILREGAERIVSVTVAAR